MVEYENCNCGQSAVWLYMPGFQEGNPFFCNDCVPRGCECNNRHVSKDAYHPPLENPDLPEGIEGVDWKWIAKDEIWCSIDDKGREWPCCEYDYDEEGYEKD
jgi:hypothetical protein